MPAIEQIQRRGALVVVAAALVFAAALMLYPEQPPDVPIRNAEVSQAARPASLAARDRPYRFDEPVAVFSLPEELREISALTFLDERHLGAVQDEEGRLYVIDQETGAVAAVMPFGPPGDYEGIELASGRLFVLRADGTLFEVEGWEGGDTRLREYATGLGTACDAEGMGFDEAGNRLLIACKEEGAAELGERRAIYAFDLAGMALGPEPVFVVDPAEVSGGKKLKPSALSVHPVTGHVFVLCSVGMELLALAPDGSVADHWDLEAAGFEQPEGLAFLPNGDLFIASEGDDDDPVLKRFAYQAAP